VTVRLTVDERAWHAHVDATALATTGLVPVVKGNGYGFGRRTLMPRAAALSDEIAVGTVFEAADVPSGRTAVVLTPALHIPVDLPQGSVLTIGSVTHIEALRAAAWRGPVTAKLATSMQRFGARPDALTELLQRAAEAGLDVVGFAAHLPLAGTDDDRLTEVLRWLPLLPEGALSVSHLGPGAQHRLAEIAGRRTIRVRLGTSLWHGDKTMLHLGVDVCDIHRAVAGDPAGYRAAILPDDGWLVLAGGGSAHGIAALEDGRSPFHFARRRLAMVEPPHMHTTMLFAGDGEGPVPGVGEFLDLQRPLLGTDVDELVWR
jgi:hypothetical protein